MLFRQGDLLIQKVEEVPEGAEALKRLTIATGSATGHRHRIRERKSARAYSAGSFERPVTASRSHCGRGYASASAARFNRTAERGLPYLAAA